MPLVRIDLRKGSRLLIARRSAGSCMKRWSASARRRTTAFR